VNRYARGQRFQDDDEIEKRNAQSSSDSEEGGEEGEKEEKKEKKEKKKTEQSDSSEEEEEESSEEGSGEEGEAKPKGPAALIETSNLNRGPKKENLKVTSEAANAKPELTRREREEQEKERKRKNYLKAYEQGKTPEARADLARLQKIRAEREAASKRREDEVKAKEDAKEAARVKARGSNASKFL